MVWKGRRCSHDADKAENADLSTAAFSTQSPPIYLERAQHPRYPSVDDELVEGVEHSLQLARPAVHLAS